MPSDLKNFFSTKIHVRMSMDFWFQTRNEFRVKRNTPESPRHAHCISICITRDCVSRLSYDFHFLDTVVFGVKNVFTAVWIGSQTYVHFLCFCLFWRCASIFSLFVWLHAIHSWTKEITERELKNSIRNAAHSSLCVNSTCIQQPTIPLKIAEHFSFESH